MLHEVCSRLSEAEDEGRALAPPTPQQLSVTMDGELVMDTRPVPPSDAGETMAGLATLIEALLPPTIRNQPDYAVPGSLRILAPRARGFPPGLPPIRTPAELDAAITRYRNGDTTLVLQQLFRRTVAAAPPASVAPPTPASAVVSPFCEPDADTNAATLPTVEQRRETTEAIVNARPLDCDPEPDLPLRMEDDLGPMRPAPAWDASRAHGDARLWLIAAAAIVLAFTVSYATTRWMMTYPHRTARADEPAQAPPVWGQTAPANPAIFAPPGQRVVHSPVSDPAARPSAARRADQDDQRKSRAADTQVGPSRTVNQASDVLEASGVRQLPLPQPTPLQTPESTGPVFSPSFAASGSALVFHAGRAPVASLMSVEISEASSPLELVTIVSNGARNYHPRLSPDGRLLAFDSDRDGERGVYVANRDGTHVRRVSGVGFAAVPSWSPDMHAIAFVRAEPDRPQVWNLWRLDRTTGVLVRLTQYRYGQTWGASWFADSRRLCFSHEDELIILDIENGSSRVFKSPLAGRLVRTPAVSPDGQLVAFQVLGSGVWLLDLDSAAMRRLIEDPSAEEFAWDPTGGRLAYHSRQSGEWRIWIAATPREVARAR